MLISLPAPPGFQCVSIETHRTCTVNFVFKVCELLHFFLQEAFPAEYDQRELDTKGVHLI